MSVGRDLTSLTPTASTNKRSRTCCQKTSSARGDPRVCPGRVRGGGVKRAIALVTESTRRDGTRQGYAAPRPMGAPLTAPAPPPKKDQLRGRCPSEDSPGSWAPNPESSHFNWTIPRGQVSASRGSRYSLSISVMKSILPSKSQGRRLWRPFHRRSTRTHRTRDRFPGSSGRARQVLESHPIPGPARTTLGQARGVFLRHRGCIQHWKSRRRRAAASVRKTCES